MPLVTVVTTKVPEHEPFTVLCADREYAVVCGGKVTTYVPIEDLAHYTSAVQAKDASAVVTTRPE
jgi:hypothetical protein